MNIQEALNVMGLSDNITAETIKEAKKKLALKYHPDRNPVGTEMMQMINSAFDFLMSQLAFITSENFACYTENKASYDYSELVAQALLKLKQLDGLIIEVIGNWLWLSGDTQKHKDSIKAAGCKWASKKKMWYFRPEEHKCLNNRKENSLESIREKYGTSGMYKGRSGQHMAINGHSDQQLLA